MSGTIHLERLSPAITLLEIDNPPMNALGRAMRESFLAALADAEADEALRCLIVTGRGRAFCSGEDLKDVSPEAEDLSGFGRLMEAIEALRVPVIAAVNGWSIGGGFELALACDLRVASSEARFVAAGVNVGLLASAYRLPRLIGLSRAKAMLLTGSPVDAETAERYGVVTEVHAPSHLREAATALAQRIASRAPLSVEAVKRTTRRAMDLTPEEGDRLWNDELQALRASGDHRDALEAFRERRDPVFSRR